MLNEILSQQEKILLSSQTKSALEKIGCVINNLKSKEKHTFIRPLKISGFSRNEMKIFGIDVSKHMWQHCDNEVIRNKGKS